MNVSAVSKRNCTGCSACVAVCPVKCISMKLDEEQFLYPQIDSSKCIECGKCLKCCPDAYPLELNENVVAYAATGHDMEDVKKSSSGGAFYLCAKYVIEELKGYVCGAVLDDNFKLEHQIADNMEDVARMQGSKYIQSKIGNCYEQIIQLLAEGKYVLFSGTPCQVAGLKKVVRKGTQNLFTLDLICHGVPSSYAFADNIKKMYGSGVYRNFTFRQRNKYLLTSFSYAFSKDNVSCKGNENQIRIFAFEDPFYQAFLDGNNYRESCYNCKYATSTRCGDITIGDCANSNAYKSLLGKSLSSVLVNTQQGEILWEKVKGKFDYEVADYKKEVKLNQQLHEPVKRSNERDSFYVDLNKMKPQDFKQKYCPKREMKEKIKHFLIWHIPVSVRIKLKSLLGRN